MLLDRPEVPAAQMKAVVAPRYGSPDVLEFVELPRPIPRPDEVLIRTRATTVSAGDWRVRSQDVPAGFGLVSRLFLGWSKPRQPVLGTELSGVVEEVGRDVRRFKVGDEVVAFSGTKMGCHAEFKVMPEGGAIARKPSNLSFEEAAALCFGGTTALFFLRKGAVRPGERVLVNGASGSVGTAAVQLAKHLGAEVTGVCSGANAELVRSLGADQVIDYRQEDFTKRGESWNVILDAVGTAPFSRCALVLRPAGRLLMVAGTLPEMLRAPWGAMRSGKKVIAGTAPERAEDVRFLADLAEAGKYRPVIDRTYPFERIVDAHRHVDAGHKKGNVVVTLG